MWNWPVTTHLCKAFISSLHLSDFSRYSLKLRSLKTFHPQGLLFNFDQQWSGKGLYDLIFSNMALQWVLTFQGF
jgi:hypothetical protein